MNGDAVVDAEGAVLTVGCRVRCVGDAATGVVEKISDPDGDVDDEGRQVYYPPRVRVRFEDGVVDEFATWTAWGRAAGHECDELLVEKGN